MNFEPNHVSSCVLSKPSVYVAMKRASYQRLYSLPMSWHQKWMVTMWMVTNDDEADGEGPHDVMMYPWLLYARLRRTKSIIIWPISFERKTVA